MSAPITRDEKLLSELAAHLRERDLESPAQLDASGASDTPTRAETRAIGDAVLARLGITEAAASPAPVIPIQTVSQRRPTLWAGTSVLTVAAALLLFWLVPSTQYADHAQYRLELPPGQSALRSPQPDHGAPLYLEGQTLRLRLIPDVRNDASLQVAAFVRVEQSIIRLPMSVARFDGGTLEVQAELATKLNVGETAARLIVVLAPASAVIHATTATELHLAKNIQRVSADIRIADAAR